MIDWLNKHPFYGVCLLVVLFVVLLAGFLALISLIPGGVSEAQAHEAHDLPPGGADGVFVLGGRYSNTYHPHYCERVRRHKNDARWVSRSWAKARGLRRHRGCSPPR